MTENELFNAEDIDILTHAVSIYPNLEYACYATKLAKENLQFPIKNYEEWVPLFEIHNLPEKIAKRKIRFVYFRKFFPKQFFPIEDPRDFLGKVLAALSWGDHMHYHEQFLKNPERFVRFPCIAPTSSQEE